MKHSSFYCFAIFTLSIGLLGCGGASDQPELGTVSGTVTLDGEPVADAKIQFLPTEGGRPSFGTSNAEGVFTLNYNAASPGATIGPHIVTITTFKQEELKPGVPGYQPGVEERIPKKYWENSELKQVVAAGDNQIDFALTQ